MCNLPTPDDLAYMYSGTFHMPSGEQIAHLTEVERLELEQLLSECEICGWYWHTDDLDAVGIYHQVCWKCFDDVEAEEEE